MSAPVRIDEADLVAAMRDARYRQSWHPEHLGFADWVSNGWRALHPEGRGAKTSVWVRDYVRAGHRVTAHWRGAPSGNGTDQTLVNERGTVPPGFGRPVPGAESPFGSSRNPLRSPDRPEPRNPPGEVQGRPYIGHGFDALQNRGLTPSIIDQAVRPQNFFRQNGVVDLYWDPINRIMVVVERVSQRVITAYPRSRPPR